MLLRSNAGCIIAVPDWRKVDPGRFIHLCTHTTLREISTAMNNLFSVTAVCLLLMSMSAEAAEPDPATQALIEQLRLDEAERPVRESPGWKRPEQIVVMIPGSFNHMREELLESFEKVSDGIDIITVSGGEFTGEEGAILEGVEVILGFCSPQLIKTAKRLRWLQHFGTGVDRCAPVPGSAGSRFYPDECTAHCRATHSGTRHSHADDADPEPAVFSSCAAGTKLAEAA